MRVGDLDTGKNFRRFEISETSEISKYSAEIVETFRTLTDEISAYQATVLTMDTGSEIEDFFRNAKSSGKPITYIPTPAESTFFLAYIEGLKISGLNWRAVPVEIMSDGAVKVRGGRIRLSKKATYISYTKSSKELATKEKISRFPNILICKNTGLLIASKIENYTVYKGEPGRPGSFPICPPRFLSYREL